MYRHHAQTLKVKELLASGAVGELQTIQGCYFFTLIAQSHTGGTQQKAAAAFGMWAVIHLAMRLWQPESPR
jgi:predicted dehydrogenase